jgi:hypothetical protein
MKKLVYSLLLIGLTTFASCEKCMVCKTTSKNTGQEIDTYPEICGRNATLNTQELTYRSTLPDSLELNCPRD